MVVPEVNEFVDHVIVLRHLLGSLRILRELSVFIIVQQEREASFELRDCKRLLEVVNVDLIAKCAVHYFLSER